MIQTLVIRWLLTAMLTGLVAMGEMECRKKEPWAPPPASTRPATGEGEASIAIRTASAYANARLGLTNEELSTMKTKTLLMATRATDMIRNSRRVIQVEFFDPAHFPNWERAGGILGGFPAYFDVTVDAETMAVIDHYASPK